MLMHLMLEALFGTSMTTRSFVWHQHDNLMSGLVF